MAQIFLKIEFVPVQLKKKIFIVLCAFSHALQMLSCISMYVLMC